VIARREPRLRLLPVGVVAVIIALAAFAGVGLFLHERGGLAVPIGNVSPDSGRVPDFGRVYLLILENHPFHEVVGDSDAPYLNSLIAKGALGVNYHSVAKPSQPNYIALFSGDTQGVKDNNVHDLDAPNLADQMEAHGKTWSVTAENVPPDCFQGEFASGGRDGPGNYARKHEPAISFTAISGRPERCARIHDLTAFDPAESDFQLIVPNLCHDAHDCSLDEADTFLSGFVPRILQSDAFANRGVLLITFDEGDRYDDRVPVIAVGEGVVPGTVSADRTTHYSLLRTLEDAWGLDCLAKACDALDLKGLFQAP
jgi:hypothetical protein